MVNYKYVVIDDDATLAQKEFPAFSDALAYAKTGMLTHIREVPVIDGEEDLDNVVSVWSWDDCWSDSEAEDMVIARHPGMEKKIVCDDSDCKPMFKPEEVENCISADITRAVLGDNSEYFDCDFGDHVEDVDTLEPADFEGDLEVHFDDDWNEVPCEGPECPAAKNFRKSSAKKVARQRDMINGKLVDAKNPESAEIEVEEEEEVDESCGRRPSKKSVKEARLPKPGKKDRTGVTEDLSDTEINAMDDEEFRDYFAGQLKKDGYLREARQVTKSKKHILAEDISDVELRSAIASDLRKRGIIDSDISEDYDILADVESDDLTDDMFIEQVGKKVIAPKKKLKEARIDVQAKLNKILDDWDIQKGLNESDEPGQTADTDDGRSAFSELVGKKLTDGNGIEYAIKTLKSVDGGIARVSATATTGPWKGKDFELCVGKDSKYLTDTATREQFNAFLDVLNSK